MSDPKNPSNPSTSEPAGLSCPVCGKSVDPRRTSQAISRNGRLLLFCSSGCVRSFMTAEADAKSR